MNPNFVKPIEPLLEKFPKIAIAVIGDFFLDKYLIIDPALAETSLETGKIANQVIKIYHSPGAAGTVTSNLSALDIGKIYAIGAIGDDGTGYELINDLKHLRVDSQYLVQDTRIFTPTYTKPIKITGAQTEEQERIDIKNRRALLPEIEASILNHLTACLEHIDGLIIADQVEESNFGVITDNVRARINDLAEQYPHKVFFADSRARIGLFRNLIIKPNKFEAYRAVYNRAPQAVNLAVAGECGQRLCQQTGRPVIVTLEQDGAMICTENDVTHLPIIPTSGAIDPVGAGDSFSAGVVAALCSRASLEVAVQLGLITASITIQKIGTTGTASPAEIRHRVQNLLIT